MAGRDSVKVLALVSLMLILDNAGVCLCRNRSSSSVCFKDERDALLQLKQSLSDTSDLLSSWKGKDCCQWTGVTCDQVNGHVVLLQITPGGEFLLSQIDSTAGELNSSLLNLRYLSYLDLSGIYFYKAYMPKFISSMKQLRYLNLSNSFSFATVPREWGNLTKLEVLDLHCEHCVLVLDDVKWVSHLEALKYLDMSAVNVTKSFGDLMQVITRLPSLSHLSLSGCRLHNLYLPSDHLANCSSLHLQYLDLSNNYFEGPIPSTIFQNMTSLRHLDLSSNSFNSSVPRWFSNLRSLVYLDLEQNHLQSVEGGLFSFLRNNQFLESLFLGHNKLHGEIFSVEGNSSGLIGKNLELLKINNNLLQGALPDWMVHLKNLKKLDLSDNHLHGAIPSSYGWLCLEALDLSYNQLTGNIPEALGRLQILSFLDLNNNLLNGTIPHSLGQLQHLDTLDLSANSLSGTVSEIHFSNLSTLSYLDISNNNLVLELDSNWMPPFNLWYIGMMSCKFATEFPRWIRTQVDIKMIFLSNASITGALPDWLSLMSFSELRLSYNQITGSLPKFSSDLFLLDLSYNQINGSLPKFPSDLYYLNLSHNQINGSLPKFSSYLDFLDLSHNLIAGPIPPNIGLAMHQLISLNLNDNLLSGTIPTSMCEMGYLYDLHLGRNELVGEIPACWKESPWILLDLSSNKLSGVMPSSLGNLVGLTSLHLNNNNLHGEIPMTISYCRTLWILDLGENKISGSVPHWIGPSFPSLQILRLRENMFNGSIPSQLCLLSMLQILDLAVNNMTGTIPNCLGYMKGMKLSKSIDEGNSLSPAYAPAPAVLDPTLEWNQEHVEQVVKGIVLDYTTLDLQLMMNLDLSSNKLIGLIPGELTLLSGLRGLNLSCNLLSGGIPTMIGDMQSLESLDLSNNHLSGTIPQSFSAFTSLNKLNLSHNNFTGPIPRGNQIQTLVDPSIYADNPLLCGDPLQKKCLGAEAPQPPKEDASSKECKLEKVMFYVVIMFGFATGFWGVIGVLVYKKNWSRAYFDYVDRKTDMVYVIVAVKATELRRRWRRA